jgi:hypothetical protein
MNNKFDELTKQMAQSVTRRAALKTFGVGLAGMALACFGLANKADANPKSACGCVSDADCTGNTHCSNGVCVPSWCTDVCCCIHTKHFCGTALPACAPNYISCSSACAFSFCP